MKNKLIIISCLFILSCQMAEAIVTEEQKFSVANNGTVVAIVSKKEITRIVFPSAIETVHSIAGELEYTVEGRDLFLRANADKPINFFVRVAGAKTYKFVVNVRDVPASQIFINNFNFGKAVKNSKAIRNNNTFYKHKSISDELKARISKIINIALNPVRHVGYKINKNVKTVRSPVDGVSLRHLGEITGKGLVAIKISITNETDTPQELNLHDFIRDEDLAVYLNRKILNAHEKATLIRISEEQ